MMNRKGVRILRGGNGPAGRRPRIPLAAGSATRRLAVAAASLPFPGIVGGGGRRTVFRPAGWAHAA